METNNARNPTAVLSDQTPRPHPSHSLLDDKKTGATLLFSGVFLALVGVTFTTIGWQHYLANPNFEWTQLLGPILISMGGTFMLCSVCRFGIISCWARRQWDEGLIMPVMEQTSMGHSFTLSSINLPITLQGATAMVCKPPAYNLTQEVYQAIDFQPCRSVNGILAALPPHYAACCGDNAAVTAEEEEEEDGSAHSTERDRRRSRTEETEDERGRGEESFSTCSRPPAYEDVYPSLNKHNPT